MSQMLYSLATEAIDQARADGAVKYSTEEWTTETIENHLRHAEVHLKKYSHRPNETDLTHAICRLVMALGVARQ